LSEAAYQQLASWGLTPQQADAAGLFPVENAATIHRDFPPEPAIVLPYFTPEGTLMRVHGAPFCRIRRLHIPPPPKGFGKPKKAAKYLQPANTGMHVYFPPGRDWLAAMRDTKSPIIITEGEAKALAANAYDFPTIGLGGVWSFSAPGGSLLADLERFQWYGRDVYIIFDSDAAENPQVVAAEARLVYELQSRLNAKARVVRLPPAADGGKQGLDDFLKAHGPDELDRLLRGIAPLSPLDAKIIGLNKSLAWIELEGRAFDMEANMFIGKDHLEKGSRWSAVKHVTVSQPSGNSRAKTVEISVAKLWLTHPHAQRFSSAIFRPGEGAITADERGTPALNMWQPMDSQPGPIQPFFDLHNHVFANLPEEHRQLAWKMFAYKAQNMQIKVPIGIVLVGPQGSGKTLWGEIMRDAFAPYGADVTPQQLASEFHGWIERSLVALINEAKGEDMEKASEQIKTLISDLRRPMNEKYRAIREVNTYTQYIITSNNRAVGSFSHDDRRMFVVSTPKKKEKAFYSAIRDWKQAGGPKHLLHFLQTYDLKGWEPPAEAPMTPEKELAYQEGLTAVQKLAHDMRNATDQTIYLWLAQAEAWAQSAELSNDPRASGQARAVRASIASTQIRPWYTAEELALMFPAIMLEVTGTRYNKTTPVGQLSRELRDAGIGYLVNRADTRGFIHQGFRRQYLVVAQFDEWNVPIGQDEFERHMRSWPTFAQYRTSRHGR
jgi:hypothetical protein